MYIITDILIIIMSSNQEINELRREIIVLRKENITIKKDNISIRKELAHCKQENEFLKDLVNKQPESLTEVLYELRKENEFLKKENELLRKRLDEQAITIENQAITIEEQSVTIVELREEIVELKETVTKQADTIVELRKEIVELKADISFIKMSNKIADVYNYFINNTMRRATLLKTPLIYKTLRKIVTNSGREEYDQEILTNEEENALRIINSSLNDIGIDLKILLHIIEIVDERNCSTHTSSFKPNDPNLYNNMLSVQTSLLQKNDDEVNKFVSAVLSSVKPKTYN